MFKNILVILDPEDTEQKALKRAVHLAKQEKTRLILFTSIYDFAYEMTTMLSHSEREQMRQSLLYDRRHWVLNLVKTHELESFEYTVEVFWHHRPFEAIIRYVLNHKVDLIVKGAKKHNTLQSIIFTPTDWHLLRKAPCPVLLVKDHAWPDQGHILAAVHATSENEPHQNLNIKLLQLSQLMSQKLNASLHLVNCYPPAPTAIAVEIPEFNTEQYQKNIYQYHQNELARIKKSANVTNFIEHLVEGIPENVIPSVAKEIDAGLVVLGTVGRTGISAALLGNTAENVIGRIKCDLLALKPDGFVSPVE